MTDIHPLAQTETVLTHCPVLVRNDEEMTLESDTDGWVQCGVPLEVVYARTVVGDDYGSWAEHAVGLRCGHDFKDMAQTMKHLEYI